MYIRRFTRRVFLKASVLTVFLMSIFKFGLAKSAVDARADQVSSSLPQTASKIPSNFLGVDDDGMSRVYIAKGMTPENNMKKAIELIGGIDKFIDRNDVVILKPNAQWWNQGTTNTNNMKGFIELVLAVPGFAGEIIIAENHHYKKLVSRGWNTEQRNGDYNLVELVEHFQQKGYDNVTKYHWVDGGPNPQPQEGNGGYGKRVSTPEDGDGYVWLKDTVYVSRENRRCIMTYPIFTSGYSGVKIDLMKGSYCDGRYVDNVKLINFSCLNHHGHSFGVTASIKNLMGIPDMTCGYQGPEPEGYYNIHFIGSMSRMYRAGTDMRYYGKKYGFGSSIGKAMQESGVWRTEFTGGALGHWMKTVKMPELNILAAEYVGWGGRGRSGPVKRHHANCVAISTDPVALDFIGAEKILLPSTPVDQEYYRQRNSPTNMPFNKFLKECNRQGIGNIDSDNIIVHTQYDT